MIPEEATDPAMLVRPHEPAALGLPPASARNPNGAQTAPDLRSPVVKTARGVNTAPAVLQTSSLPANNNNKDDEDMDDEDEADEDDGKTAVEESPKLTNDERKRLTFEKIKANMTADDFSTWQNKMMVNVAHASSQMLKVWMIEMDMARTAYLRFVSTPVTERSGIDVEERTDVNDHEMAMRKDLLAVVPESVAKKVTRLDPITLVARPTVRHMLFRLYLLCSPATVSETTLLKTKIKHPNAPNPKDPTAVVTAIEQWEDDRTRLTILGGHVDAEELMKAFMHLTRDVWRSRTDRWQTDELSAKTNLEHSPDEASVNKYVALVKWQVEQQKTTKREEKKYDKPNPKAYQATVPDGKGGKGKGGKGKGGDGKGGKGKGGKGKGNDGKGKGGGKGDQRWLSLRQELPFSSRQGST